MSKTKKEKKPTRISKIILISSTISILALGAIVAAMGYYVFTVMFVKQYNDYAYEIADVAKTYVDGDTIKAYVESGVEDEEYLEIQQRLDDLTVSTQCSFIYISQAITDDFKTERYIFDSVNPSLGFDRYPLNYTAEDGVDEYVPYLKEIYKTGGNVDDYLYSTSESGPHTTAISAITDSDGEVVAIVCVEKPMSLLEEAQSRYLTVVLIITAIILFFVLIGNYHYTRKNIARPIEEIIGEAEKFARTQESGGELKAQTSTNELGTLANALKKMEQDINDYMDNLTKVTAEKERISVELDTATKIQADMLPTIFPNFVEKVQYDIFATMNPAKEVGGDFYDFFYIDDTHLGLVIADVSGKGVPAALFMVIAKTLIKTRAQIGGSPSEIFVDVNNQLCEGNDANLFVTAWLGIVDLETGHVIECNAGHECPAICHEGGEFELRETKHDIVLAAMDGMPYTDYEFDLEKGDTLYLYTDGVPEATNGANEMFGEERMVEALNHHKGERLDDLLHHMKEDLDVFVGDAPQFDDVTMVGYHFK